MSVEHHEFGVIYSGEFPPPPPPANQPAPVVVDPPHKAPPTVAEAKRGADEAAKQLAVVDAEIAAAVNAATDAQARVAKLEGAKQSQHVNPIDASEAIKVIRDLEQARRDLSDAIASRKTVEALRPRFKKLHDAAREALMYAEHRERLPEAERAIAECVERLDSFCAFLADTLDKAKAAGVQTTGVAWSKRFTDVYARHNLIPATFGVKDDGRF